MSDTTYLSLGNSSDEIKRRNLYIGSAIIGFIWISFHFTAIYFFTWILGSAFFVGLYMAVGNLVALLVDIPIGMIQRYFSPKKLLLTAASLQLLASFIFTKFIFFTNAIDTQDGIIDKVLSLFLDDIGNLALLLLASMCYGVAKELYDITIMSYILNNSNPSEYPSIISKNNLITGGGMLLGLLGSGILLSFGQIFVVLCLNVFIVLLMVFISLYFDNERSTLSIADIHKLKCIVQKESIQDAGKYLIAEISKADVAKIASKVQILFLRPMQHSQSPIHFGELLQETKKEMQSVFRVIFPIPLLLLWFILVATAFGFWDTFAASFLIDHIKSFQLGAFTFVLLGALAIPAFGLQAPFLALSKTVGEHTILAFGVLCSGASLLCMGLFGGESIWIFFLCALCNSIGFAAAVPLAQAGFIEGFTVNYSRIFSTSEVDSNIAAGPCKMVQNIANVAGLLFGGMLVSLLGYSGFFLFFGTLLIGLFAFGIVKKISGITHHQEVGSAQSSSI